MKKLIYKLCHKLYKGGVISWKLWSFVYDRLHRFVDDPWN